ncbi:unnamed protein product, partial [Prorocentrum cordatum]
FLPARSLAQPRDSTRVVPAVPCCRSQPHCSSGSRGRDGKTAGEPPTSRRREQITPRGRRPGLWQQAAAGRRRHRAGLLRGVPARQARPPRPALPSKAAPARVGTPTPLAGGAWAKPSSTDCGPLSHLRHNAACELVSPDNSLRTYVFPTIRRGAASRPPPC